MLAPEFCYTLPQTTRQVTGPAPPEDNSDDLPHANAARGRGKAMQRKQAASAPAWRAGPRGNRSLAGQPAPVSQHSVGARAQRLPGNVCVATADGRDTDSNDWEDDEPQEERQGRDLEADEQEDEQEEEEEEQPPPPPPQQRAPKGRVAAGAGAWRDTRAAAAQAYGVGSRNGRAQALLGVTAAAAAAEAAAGDGDMDLDDAQMRTALHAAQEVLTNPAAARILLRLMRQPDGQQQIPQGKFQDDGRDLHVSGIQGQVRSCRPRRRHGAEVYQEADEEDEDCGGEREVDEREAPGHAAGPSGGKADPARPWQGEQVAGASGVRYAPLNEGRGQRMGYAHLSSRSAPGAPGGRSEGGHRAFFPGPTSFSGGMAPHSSATGVAGCVGSAAAFAGRQMGMAGRLESFGGGGPGMGRSATRAQAADDASGDTEEEDEAAEQGEWSDQLAGVDDDGEWDGEDGLEAARRHGATVARPPHTAGVQHGRARSRAAAVPPLISLGRRAGSPHRGRSVRQLPPEQPLQYMPSAAHLNAATTAAAAAAAAIAAATAAGEAPLRLAGHRHGPLLGKRSWLESNGIVGLGADQADEAADELQAYPHPPHLPYQAAMHPAAYPPPLVLRRMAEELQAYHSRSAAAAAAAAAAVANVQQPRGYHGHILC